MTGFECVFRNGEFCLMCIVLNLVIREVQIVLAFIEFGFNVEMLECLRCLYFRYLFIAPIQYTFDLDDEFDSFD